MRRKDPKPITAAYLERVVDHYLSRYYTSSAHLERLLMKRVRRSVAHHGHDLAEKQALVQALIARLVAQGVLNDEAYARSKALGLHRRGSSERAIRARLAEKGLPGGAVEEALDAVRSEAPEADLAAACTYARKRRIGPYRRSDREAHRDRDLARLARQGFSYAIASRVLEAPDPDALEDLLR